MKTNTLKQRLALYRAAHKRYQKKSWLDEYLCHLFIDFDSGFREMQEVCELTTPAQRKQYVMFNTHNGVFEKSWQERNKFLIKLIKHTEKKIAQGKK